MRSSEHIVEHETDDHCELALLSADGIAALTASQETLTAKQKMALVGKVHIFRHLSNDHCHLIVNSLRTVIRKKGEAAVKEGELGSQFFVSKSG